MSEPVESPPAPARSASPAARGVEWLRGPGGRVAIFVAVLLVVIGYPLAKYLTAVVTGGISRKADRVVVDLKAMSLFEMDQVAGTDAEIPSKWRGLDGQRVETTGEIWSPYSAAGQMAGFQLCYSIAKCCFNGPPQVQHFVQATVPPGRTADYHPGLVKVVGRLHVGVQRSQGRIHSVYRMEVESVTPE